MLADETGGAALRVSVVLCYALCFQAFGSRQMLVKPLMTSTTETLSWL